MGQLLSQRGLEVLAFVAANLFVAQECPMIIFQSKHGAKR